MVILPDVSLVKSALGSKTNLPPLPMTTLLRRSVSVSSRIGSFICTIPSADSTYNKIRNWTFRCFPTYFMIYIGCMLIRLIITITVVDSVHFVSSGMSSGHAASDVCVPSKTWMMINKNISMIAEILESSPLRTNVYWYYILADNTLISLIIIQINTCSLIVRCRIQLSSPKLIQHETKKGLHLVNVTTFLLRIKVMSVITFLGYYYVLWSIEYNLDCYIYNSLNNWYWYQLFLEIYFESTQNRSNWFK